MKCTNFHNKKKFVKKVCVHLMTEDDDLVIETSCANKMFVWKIMCFRSFGNFTSVTHLKWIDAECM